MAIGDNNAPITITFDSPTNNLLANFTYGSQLSFSAFDSNGSPIGTYITPGTSNLGSTEVILLNFTQVGSLVIAGQTPNTFIMDDFNYK